MLSSPLALSLSITSRPRQDDDRVPVFADFPVRLGVEVRGRDQDAELACRSREMSRLVSRTPTPWLGT
jgi:hypothetical protein